MSRRSRPAPQRSAGQEEALIPEPPPGLPVPDPRDRRLEAERGTLRLIVRAPEVFGEGWNDLVPDDFTHPTYRALFEAVLAAADGPQQWTQRIVAARPDPVLEQLVVSLAVEPVLREPTQAYAREYAARLRLQLLSAQIAELKSRLQRTNPLDDQVAYNKQFARLVDMEKQRKELIAEATAT